MKKKEADAKTRKCIPQEYKLVHVAQIVLSAPCNCLIRFPFIYTMCFPSNMGNGLWFIHIHIA